MNRKHKITIPEPCHEDWSKMTPNENGLFCFLYAQTNYYKMFSLALFVTIGASLFSCTDKNGKKKKNDTIEIVADTSKTESSVGKASISKNDSDKDVPPPPKVDHNKFAKPKENDNLKSEKTNDKKNSSAKMAVYATTTGEVVSETNAEFPGGIEQFYNYFGKQFKSSESINTQNLKINLSFAVEKNGSVSYLQCVPAVDDAIEQEIIRVLSLCPKWQPGEINGKKVKRQYSLPIVLQ